MREQIISIHNRLTCYFLKFEKLEPSNTKGKEQVSIATLSVQFYLTSTTLN